MTNQEFEILARRLRITMLHSAERLLGSRDEAEDVVQEALLKLWAMRDRLGDYRSPEALARIVVKRLSLNVLRNYGRHPMVELRAEYGDDAEADEQSRERIRTLLEAVDRLPSKQQMILRMKHIEGMETEEIAEVAQMSIDAIYQNLSRARRAVLNKFKQR